MVLGAVGVGNAERAARGQGAVFGHRAGRRPGDGGGVGAAGDGDVDGLGVGAVEGVDRQEVVHDLAAGERLHVALAVGERVAPRAGLRIEGEAAIGPRQRGRDLEVVLGAVGIGNAERAARGQGAVFGHRAGRRPGDGGGVIRSFNNERSDRSIFFAGFIDDRYDERFDHLCAAG